MSGASFFAFSGGKMERAVYKRRKMHYNNTIGRFTGICVPVFDIVFLRGI